MAASGSATRGRRRGAAWRGVAAALLLAGSLAGPAGPASAADTGVIAGADEGVRLRADPGFDGDVLGTLWDGMAIGLRIDEADTVLDPDGETRWWPISTDLGDGWVAGAYLQIDGWDTGAVAASAAAPAPAPAADDGAVPAEMEQESVAVDEWDGPDLTWSSTARVADADGVNLRAEPGGMGEVLRALGSGEVVSLRSGASTVWADGMRWWPVAADALEGWVAGPYLEPADAAPADDGADAGDDWVVSEVPAASGKVADFSGLGWVTVATDDGTGVNLRADAAPDAERIGQAFEGDVVELLDGPMFDPIGNDWFLVADSGVTGWVFGDYLIPGSDPAKTPARTAEESFSFPLSGFTMTQAFGCSPYPWFYAYNPWLGCNAHDALDLAAPWYTPLSAARSGEIEQAGWCDCGLGYYVKIDHGGGLKSVYGHMAEPPVVTPGQRVRKNDLIGYVGSTGNSTGPHVHFAVELNGTKVDPLPYMP